MVSSGCEGDVLEDGFAGQACRGTQDAKALRPQTQIRRTGLEDRLELGWQPQGPPEAKPQQNPVGQRVTLYLYQI